MRNAQLTSKCLNGGVKKAFVDFQRWPTKTNDFVRILLLPLDPGQVILALLHNISIDGSSTKEIFSCSLISTICIFVSRLCGDTHSPCTPKHVQLDSDPQNMKHLLVIFRYVSML